ncbi:MAG: FGGY family carbohydrate kinase [Lentisphaeria bacterium]
MKKELELFLCGLDLGTTAIKGVIIDQNGTIIAEGTKNNSMIVLGNDRFEINPEEQYRMVCSLIKELAEKTPGKIAALSMAVASGNLLFTDADGKPLTNIISWMDRRAAQDPPKVLSHLTSTEVRQITGWSCLDSFPLAQLAWFQENKPELYNKASRYCMNSDWLLFRLTGKWQMDYSTATTSHLQDQRTFTYHKEYLKLLNIEEKNLSLLVPTARFVGTVISSAVEDTGLSESTKVVSGSFDHPSSARGANINEPGQLMLSCGTSWVGFFPEKDRQKIINLGLLCDPFLASEGGPWGAIFSVPYIGRMIDWYIDNLIALGNENKYEVFNHLASKAHPGAGGLKIDLRKEPVLLKASPENISRAVMENAAELLNEEIQRLLSKGIKFNHVIIVGGVSKSKIWIKIIEEITALKIEISSSYAGARGAAIVAGFGVK